MLRRGRLAALLPVLLLAGCDGGGKRRSDLERALAAAPHVVSAEERTTGLAGHRLFHLEIEQPVDHDAPAGATFLQFASLLWRDAGRPVVLATNGYSASRNPGRAEITVLLDANQLQVEHRFFDPSSPDPKDWSRLDVRQAAADLHRIVESLRPVLGPGAWLSVGASKGGMTAVYHRYFHPDDVDGTLAYVAPQSFSTVDPAYATFLLGVGGDEFAQCRERIAALQRALLERRAEVEPIVATWAELDGLTFDFFGLQTAYTFAVLEMPFNFWQYQDAAFRCPFVVRPDAPPQDLVVWLYLVTGSVGALDDAVLEHYAPYFYQSATQLGGPAYPQEHLLDLLPGGVPADDDPALYPPTGVPKPYDAAAMPAVDAWVRSEGERLLFVYGELDPWSSRPFEPTAANDAFRWFVPGGNHLSAISDLPEADRLAATAAVRRWAGLAPQALTADEPPDFDRRALLEGERGAPQAR